MQKIILLLFFLSSITLKASEEAPLTYEAIKKLTGININAAIESFLVLKILRCETWDERKSFTSSLDFGECLYVSYRSKLRDHRHRALIYLHIQSENLVPQKIELLWNPGLDTDSEFKKWLKNINELKNEYLECKSKYRWNQDKSSLFEKYQKALNLRQDSNILNEIEIRFHSALEAKSLLSKYFFISSIHNIDNIKNIKSVFVTDPKNYKNSIAHSEIVYERFNQYKSLEFYWQVSVNLFCPRNLVSFESPP